MSLLASTIDVMLSRANITTVDAFAEVAAQRTDFHRQLHPLRGSSCSGLLGAGGISWAVGFQFADGRRLPAIWAECKCPQAACLQCARVPLTSGHVPRLCVS